MLWPGLWAGLILGFAMGVIYHLYLDPVLRTALASTSGPKALSLRYPLSLTGGLALILWVAGFETMFFQAGSLSFFSRLTPHAWLAIVGAVSFRTMVTSLQISQAGVVDAFPLFLVQAAATSTVACILFARAGLPAAMLFAATVTAHVLLPRMP
jgi:hypothetical protein